MKWFFLSIVAAIALAMHVLVMTKIIKLGVPISRANFFVFLCVAILLLFQQLILKDGFTLKVSYWPYVFFAALGAFLVIQLSLMAIKDAPNPGYVNGLESLSAIIISIAAVYLFQSSLSITKVLGIICCLAGAFLIGI